MTKSGRHIPSSTGAGRSIPAPTGTGRSHECYSGAVAFTLDAAAGPRPGRGAAPAGRRRVAGDLRPAPGVPPPVPPEGRHDFVLAGRLNPYKNIDVVLRAWQRHATGAGWRGDNLVLIGDGPISLRSVALPQHTRWLSGGYRYSDVVETLAAAKGPVVHYRRASQSGVQVLSMQLGVMPIVSTVGGLHEYQPPGGPMVDIDDVAGLAAAFDKLADPAAAAHHGATAACHYAQRLSADRVAGRLLEILAEVQATRLRFGSSELESAGERPGRD